MSSELKEEILVPKNKLLHIFKHKKEIESKGKVTLKINKSNNSIELSSKDAENIWLTKQVLLAVGRGFTFRIAEKLFNPEFRYIQLHLQDYGGKNKKQQTRLRSRVIGRNGTSKRKIQRETKTDISISGKTVSIIGREEGIEVATEAIEMLLSGAKHSTVYSFIGEH